MKMRKTIPAVTIAVLFLLLGCAGALAATNNDNSLSGAFQSAEAAINNYYTLSGVVELGGGFLIDAPSHADRGYLEKYLPFPTGVLANVDVTLTSKNDLDYYHFRMSNPGYADQDFFFEAGRIGVYNVSLEYDQLQNIYCTANPNNDEIGILVQRLRFNGVYSTSPTHDIYVKDLWLKRNGEQPSTANGSPSSGYDFSAQHLAPIDYSQNNATIGSEWDLPTYQFRVAYNVSTFQDGNSYFLDAPLPSSRYDGSYMSLPPSNMAQYITAEGAMNLPAYKTRLASSFTYGRLSQDDTVYDAGATSSATGLPVTSYGGAELTASTIAGYLSGVTHVSAPLTLRYSYSAYDFQNSDLNNPLLQAAYSGTDLPLLYMEHYSYLKQTVTTGAQYKLNNFTALDVAYKYEGVDRTELAGSTSTNSPQVGMRFFPTDWMNLIVNYAYSDRQGSDFLELAPGDVLTYKFYAGDDKRNQVNLIAEMFPVNNITFSFNFSFYNDDFNNSSYGLLSDHGWSPGADVSWTPSDRVSLSLGYDHQEDSTKELAASSAINGAGFLVTGDSGPILVTSDSYDTVTASAAIKLIPDKLMWRTSASYSYSSSDFHNAIMPNLNESFADLNTFLAYKINRHWGCKVGYIFEIFQMTKAYQTLYLTGYPSGDQSLNTLDGFYNNATAHVVEGFLQYQF